MPTASTVEEVVVSLYKKDTVYGGPEEGGWWYDWYTLVDHLKVPRSGVEAAKATLISKHTPDPTYRVGREDEPFRGEVYGPEEVVALEEDFPGQHETKFAPHYE